MVRAAGKSDAEPFGLLHKASPLSIDINGVEMNPQKIDMLVNKMTSLVEEEFTKKVLMPLFMAMGYKTDYHGGGYEGGKDLIFWKKDDFGEKELTVVQVKMTSVSAAASDKNGFPEIVTQLGQALEKQVPELDGTKRIMMFWRQ